MSGGSIEQSILSALASSAPVTSDALAATLGVDHQEVVGAAKSLEAEGYLQATMSTKMMWRLSNEGQQIATSGSPEFRLWTELGEKGEVRQTDLETQLGKAATGIALSNGMKAKWLRVIKRDGDVFLSRNPAVSDAADAVRDLLARVQANTHVDPKDAEMLKKRRLATQESLKVFTYVQGPGYAVERRAKAVGDLTREMLQDGSWRTASFKTYNLGTAGAEVDGGELHPLLKVRQEFREIFMELGFQEMPTQHWVESSFWNFDSLFIPQQHPARDVQDTFFLSKPSTSRLGDEALAQRVRASHEANFHSAWRPAEAARNVLRTHTTGSSAFLLFQLAQASTRGADGRLHFKPGRYYSIDRVFRNEEMDRTHLCEFHQVEGFVIDRDISLAKMMHTFDLFFRRIGVEKLRFKPAFNPYTEPSMEIFGYHTGLKKWIEVGNSGLFRPELLGPLGFSEGTSVMAWGLSLERPTMIKYGINSIHELFGHRVDVKFIKRSAIARF